MPATIESYFADIADAIRERGDTSAGLTPAGMPQAILDIPGGGGGVVPESIRITVTGGYNGGAIITIYINGIPLFTSTGNSPYNLAYTPPSGTITRYTNVITVSISPPATSTSPLVISLTRGITYTSPNIMPNGSNTSYGYNYDSGPVVIS